MSPVLWRFFVSDLHGDHRHRILTDGIGASEDIDLRWTPDSKHLSFLSHNQLYLVPVD